LETILNNVDLLILSSAFLSLIATGVVFNIMRKEVTPHPEFGHMTGPTLLLVILTMLLFLTWLTVAVSYLDLGGLNVVVAMGVATIKGSLVALYFMHLRWDRPYNAIIFVASLLFLGVFLGFALLDTAEYNPSLIDDPFLKIPVEQYGTEQG
jgi:cytochrome c oxidase subunit 4